MRAARAWFVFCACLAIAMLIVFAYVAVHFLGKVW